MGIWRSAHSPRCLAVRSAGARLRGCLLKAMRLRPPPSAAVRLASSVLAGLLATGTWNTCQPPAPASAIVQPAASTMQLAASADLEDRNLWTASLQDVEARIAEEKRNEEQVGTNTRTPPTATPHEGACKD